MLSAHNGLRNKASLVIIVQWTQIAYQTSVIQQQRLVLVNPSMEIVLKMDKLTVTLPFIVKLS